jgi:hypothetical protein
VLEAVDSVRVVNLLSWRYEVKRRDRPDCR